MVKKIRGKIHFFGVWSNPDAALEKYLNQKEDLHSRHHTNYCDFQAAIDTCLDELDTTHKHAIASLITTNF